MSSLLSTGIAALLPTQTASAALVPGAKTQADCEAGGNIWTPSGYSGSTFNAASCNTPFNISAGKDLDWQIRSMIYFRAIGNCIKNAATSSNFQMINEADAKSGKWFSDQLRSGGTSGLSGQAANTASSQMGPYVRDLQKYIQYGGGKAGESGKDFKVNVTCADPSFVKDALALWGNNAGKPWAYDDALCSFYYGRSKGVSQTQRENGELCTDAQRNGTGSDWQHVKGYDESYSAFLSSVSSRVYGGTIPDYSQSSFDAFWYAFYLKVFQQSCIKGSSSDPKFESNYNASDNNSYTYSIIKVGDDGVIANTPADAKPTDPATHSFYLGNQKRGQVVPTRQSTTYNNATFDKTCGEIEGYINRLYKAFKDLALTNPELTGNRDAGTLGGDDDPTTGATSCVAEGIGWLICPLMTAIGGLNDAMYGWVESVLVLNPLSQTMTDSSGQTMTDSSGASVLSPQYENWSRIRDIANVLLVVGFLAIIFSQITSIGISNYGVKKMLPRIVLIAIAINLSWVLMSLAVDVVNVLGVGLNTLLESTAVNATKDALGYEETAANLVAGKYIAAGAAVAGTVAIVAAGATGGTLILLALPFILGAALALLAAVATLFLRNALVILLVIVSPVAIVAYLLPNTEEYFKKWRKLFMSMLLLFPLAALLFAGAKFAAYVIVTSGQPLAQIAALFIMAAPLGMLPWLANSSGGILAAVNGKMGSMAKGIQGAAQKGLADRIEAQQYERRNNQRNFLGFKREKFKGKGERYEEDQYARHTKTDKRRNIKKGDIKKDKDGEPIVTARAGDYKIDPATGRPVGTKERMRNWSQMWAESGDKLKERTANAQQGIKSGWKQRALANQGEAGNPKTFSERRAQADAAIVDAGLVEGLRTESVAAQYKGRLEVSKLVDGEVRTLYDRQQDAGAQTHALEQEQALRQKDRTMNSAQNTATGLGLSRLAQVDAGANISDASAARMQNLAEASLEGGGLGLKVIHENAEAAEQGVKTFDAQFEAELAERKRIEGDLFQSAAAEAAFKARATTAGKQFDATIKELATKDTKKRKLEDRLVGPKPDPEDRSKYRDGESDEKYQKELREYEKRKQEFNASTTAQEAGGLSLRDTLQTAATKDYVATSRIQQAEMDKTLGIDAEMQTPEGKELLRDATGVGTQKRVKASAAKRLKADHDGDVSASEDQLENNATSRDQALALMGTDSDNKRLFDENGNFVYQTENPEKTPEEVDQVWNDYEAGRKKIGQPLDPDSISSRNISQEPALDNVEMEALLRRTIKQGDKKANVRPTLDFLRRNVANAKKAQANLDPNATDEEKEDAENAVDNAVKLQSAGIEQYSRTPGALSPFMSSGDQGALVDGTFIRTPDELVINTFGSEKLGDPGFAAGWNIDQYKDAAIVFEDLGKAPSKLSPEVRGPIDSILADQETPIRPGDPGYEDAFYKARVDKYFDDIMVQDGITVPPEPAATAPQEDQDAYRRAKARQDTMRAKKIQSFSDSRKGIDEVDSNAAYKPDGRAHEQIYKIRNVLDVLEQAGAIPEPSKEDNGAPYRRLAYTKQPGVVKTTSTGEPIYLKQVANPANPKGFDQVEYTLDPSGNELPLVTTVPITTQQDTSPNTDNGNGTARSADDLIIPRR